ncbi:centrosomal protein of 63 kDa isoform X6 [Pristis pectinata]|uniref:centrosomal protein of 63 kDa isoform X6 n=1 Tax=Pristis pectinata TaxID=685728 RepID=UPI00223D95A9|nr:centrosomal protein of 63 kDa isoform X6 [Pristis pectinata]
MEALLEAVQNLGQDGNVLTTCEAELQELMKQIDIMMAHKKSEWEAQFQSVETRLKVREQELGAIRLMLDQKQTEVDLLRQQLQDSEKIQHDMVVQYESQLNIFQAEIEKLKKSYEKLQRRQFKEVREDMKDKQDRKESMSELNRLNKKVEQQAVLYQTQLGDRKQLVKQTELISQSEMQHLRSQLERANDTICANDMSMERLNMTVDELKAANQRFKEGQQLLQEDVQHWQQQLQKSMEENEELHKKLQEQEYIIQSKDHQQKQLYKELSRCNELLQATEKTNRSSESLKQQCNNASYSQAELQQEVPLRTGTQGEKNLTNEVTVLQQSLDSANEEVFKKQEQLKQMEEEHNKYKSDVKKLRDQLNLVEQQHHSEMKGMKLEISQLTTELHQRDVTIAAMSAATSNMERQLQSELEKTDRKAKEIKLTQIQFETLKLENQHLAGILKGNRQNCSLMDLRDGYVSSLRQLEQENQRLQQELADVRSKLEMSVKVSQDRYEMLLLQIQNKLTDIRETEDRRVEELQLEHQKELRGLQKRLREMTTNTKEGKQLKQSQHPLSKSDCSNLTDGPGQAGESDHSNAHQRDSCDVSPSDSLHGITSCITLSAEENEADLSDSVSVQSLRSLHSDQLLPLSLAAESPNMSIAAKFLEEEDKRSQQLLKQLDMHIEELKIESERTVNMYG